MTPGKTLSPNENTFEGTGVEDFNIEVLDPVPRAAAATLTTAPRGHCTPFVLCPNPTPVFLGEACQDS